MIDLHTHSTASDGLLAPGALVATARAAGVSALALTDHDSTAGVAEAQAAGAALGLEVIAGVEINTDLPGGGDAHVLGYFFDPAGAWATAEPAGGAGFQAELATRRAERERRGREMVARLRAVGLPITWEQVRAKADGAVGRPHVAAALIELGAAATVDEAFARYLDRGRPGYVGRMPFTPAAAVRLIRAGGGVAALAHPAGIGDLAAALGPMVAAGLRGLETYYGAYDAATVARLLAVGREFDLIPTGGTDYHGPGLHPTPLGGRGVPAESLARLRREAAGAM